MNSDDLSNIKSNLSLAYVRAIAATLNFAFKESYRDVDGIGIDCTIYNQGIGSNISYSMSSEINVQVKAFSKSSITMYRDRDTVLEYRLNKDLKPRGAVFYLFVVELPAEDMFDDWVHITPEELIMKKCAYYIRIQNVVTSGFIQIPKSNQLTFETFPSLFISPFNKELSI